MVKRDDGSKSSEWIGVSFWYNNISMIVCMDICAHIKRIACR